MGGRRGVLAAGMARRILERFRKRRRIRFRKHRRLQAEIVSEMQEYMLQYASACVYESEESRRRTRRCRRLPICNHGEMGCETG